MQLKEWIKIRRLDAKDLTPRLYQIGDELFYIVKPKEDKLINKDMLLLLDEDDRGQKCDYYIFEFGGRWYMHPKSEKKVSFIRFENIGDVRVEIPIEDFPYLGIHGEFELYNGTAKYKEWISRAKFYGIKSLGLVERNTLAGVLQFQEECQRQKIKSIIGEEIKVKRGEKFYQLKIYVKNNLGWVDLLQINKEIKVLNHDFIEEDRLLELLSKNVIVVFDKWIKLQDTKILRFQKIVEDNLYYQWDTVEYNNNFRDTEFLQLQKHNLKFFDKIPFLLINDTYYINEEDHEIKKKLNEMNPRSTIEEVSQNQYFKTLDDNFIEMESLYKHDDSRIFDFFQEMLENTKKVAEVCNFEYDITLNRLPQFTQNHLPEETKASDNEDLFWNLIQVGLSELQEREEIDLDKYLNRIEIEADVIIRGGFVDYFLILWDIVKFSKDNDILVGPGRGSAAGCLISYLLKITNIDPLKFDLIFERFLNEGRIESGELPDIDCDFMGRRRGEVKKYMEYVYGEHQVCSVGTYGTFQLKAAIKDLLRSKLPFTIMNELVKDSDFFRGDEWSQLFEKSQENPDLKKVILGNVKEINQLRTIHQQSKNTSIHAAAVLILPKRHGDVYSQIPVRKEGDMLISEWEGEDLSNAGFLKEDILGTNQLNKFSNIIKLIKEYKNIDIDFYDIPLDDKEVYKYYQKGWNADNFHFGSYLLTSYSRRIHPDNINDLIAMIALVRPGALEAGSADAYVKFKKGEEKVTYLPGLEEITKDTYGLIVYQEQVMKACQILGDFSLTEADGIRKAIGKKLVPKIRSYKSKFVENAIAKGYKESDINDIWDLLEIHGGYSFNKSHASAYAITGYICNWFKVNYPLEFWTTAFDFADKKRIPKYISEIHQLEDSIQLKQIDINNSKDHFYSDFNSETLFWSLNSVKQVGTVVLGDLMKEREEGDFFSFKEFYTRIKKNKRKVNKAAMENLIFSGAFDEIEEIKIPSSRIKVFDQLQELLGLKDKNKSKVYFEEHKDEDWWWLVTQLELSGYAYIDYLEIIKSVPEVRNKASHYRSAFSIKQGDGDKRRVIAAGVVSSFAGRKSKRGEWGMITLDNNFEQIKLILWNESWLMHKDKFEKDKILIVSGDCSYDKYRKESTVTLDKKSIVKIL